MGIGALERDFQREIPDSQISRVAAALAHLRQTLLDTLTGFHKSADYRPLKSRVRDR